MPKYGDTNPSNGLIFIQRGPTYPSGEYWVTPEVFDKRRKALFNKRKSRMQSDPSFAEIQKRKETERRERADVKKKRVNRHKENMKRNPIYAIKFLTRMRIATLKKRNGQNKSKPSRKMLGADPWICKKFIEDQFTDGMNWDNRGKWHIDHFFPISLAKAESEVRIFSHFTNLRPLWATDNSKKHATPPTPSEMIERDAWVESWIKNTQSMNQ